MTVTNGKDSPSPVPVLVFDTFHKSFAPFLPKTSDITWIPVDHDNAEPLDPAQSDLASQSRIFIPPFKVPGRDLFVDVEKLLQKRKSVELLVAPSAGIEHFAFPGLTSRVRVTISQVNSIAIAEYVLSALLRHAKRHHVYSEPGSEEWWERGRKAVHEELDGKRIFVLGLGGIGLEVAKRAAAFGLDVVGSKRKVQGVPLPPFVNKIYSADEWTSNTELLSTIDYLVLAAPASSSTENIVNHDLLSKLKKGAYIINIARGPLVDETALIEHIESGHISGAALDVFREEPLATTSPLFKYHPHPIFLTPHQSWSNNRIRERLQTYVRENIRRFTEGAELVGEVPREPSPAGKDAKF
ncbi:hypothetical protein M427DRAFT_67036 [Gonapodya prolifera JEL478]|uniref:D-isomer specific 2-hydroxyacid dehydrogenase NAD-binding domain-containing protein n=1 Tax=Gonapodya prolifera (strain JEL478) TaxID=1344416 RepID=A0A139ATZ9_GONPJ|nr:hypothetical protein M427DRAFT_67036 [Gonapodya prolifera JEL478]|eukprot:KXS19975.1 hypothetical protein M427DRAFT_67036 [Gonapodya prolifera JEL478]